MGLRRSEIWAQFAPVQDLRKRLWTHDVLEPKTRNDFEGSVLIRFLFKTIRFASDEETNWTTCCKYDWLFIIILIEITKSTFKILNVVTNQGFKQGLAKSSSSLVLIRQRHIRVGKATRDRSIVHGLGLEKTYGLPVSPLKGQYDRYVLYCTLYQNWQGTCCS
jgi:hypothetical protein